MKRERERNYNYGGEEGGKEGRRVFRINSEETNSKEKGVDGEPG